MKNSEFTKAMLDGKLLCCQSCKFIGTPVFLDTLKNVEKYREEILRGKLFPTVVSSLKGSYCPDCNQVHLPGKLEIVSQEFGNEIEKMPKTNKCTCGAWAVPHHPHSKWCDLK